jgi:hypothetical protein
LSDLQRLSITPWRGAVGCAIIDRHNLTQNLIMLIHPIKAIKCWQMGDR